MRISILTLGKLKESYWKDAEKEYLKRLGQYAKIEFIELKEEPFRDGDDREKVKRNEAEIIQKRLPEGAVVIALYERGKQMDSVALAEFLENNSTRGEHIVFVIGGPLGLGQSVLDRADYQLSLSSLTFPHQMVRTILLEQLYRAGTIQRGKQYHY